MQTQQADKYKLRSIIAFFEHRAVEMRSINRQPDLTEEEWIAVLKRVEADMPGAE